MLTCQRSVLFNALTELKTIIQQRHVVPALTSVLLRYDVTELVLCGTDTFTSLYLTIPCTGTAANAFMLPFRPMLDWLHIMAGDTVTFNFKTDTCRVTVKNATKTVGHCTLATLPATDFPVDNAELFNVPGIILPTHITQALKQVAVAALDDMSNPTLTLNALCFNLTSTNLQLYATDRYRLAVQNIPCTLPVTSTFLVTNRSVQLNLLPLLVKCQVPTFTIYEKFNCVGFVLTCPDWQAILVLQKLNGHPINISNGLIPTDQTLIITVPRVELLTTIAAAQIFGRENLNRVNFHITEDTLNITSQALHTGTHDSVIAITTSDPGQTYRITLNATYLLEYLKVCQTDTITLSLGPTAKRPLLFSTDTNGLYVLMPIVEQVNV